VRRMREHFTQGTTAAPNALYMCVGSRDGCRKAESREMGGGRRRAVGEHSPELEGSGVGIDVHVTPGSL